MNIEINGVTLQADFMDADFMDKLEPALAETQRKIANGKMQQYSSISAAYRALNEVMENFFDQVFGAGTSDRLFNGSQNVMEHMKAVAVINDQCNSAKKEFNDFTNRYSQRARAGGFNSMQGHNKPQKYQNRQ